MTKKISYTRRTPTNEFEYITGKNTDISKSEKHFEEKTPKKSSMDSFNWGFEINLLRWKREPYVWWLFFRWSWKKIGQDRNCEEAESPMTKLLEMNQLQNYVNQNLQKESQKFIQEKFSLKNLNAYQ